MAFVSRPECLVVLQSQRWPTMMIHDQHVCGENRCNDVVLTAKVQCLSSVAADLETVLEWFR